MSKPITTTLNEIRKHAYGPAGWGRLLKHLGKTKADDEPLKLLTILESNGMSDCLWCARATHGHDRLWRLYAVWCARQVQHLMTDQRSLDALDFAERWANGNLTAADRLAVTRRAAVRAYLAAKALGPAAYEDWFTAATSIVVLEPKASQAALLAAPCAAWGTAMNVSEAKLRQILIAGEWVDE